jgi:Mitochondrial carrier protein
MVMGVILDFILGICSLIIGVLSGLKSIYVNEGLRGLYRGSLLSMGRSIVGSGANLSTFSLMKEYLVVERKWNDVNTLGLIIGCIIGYGCRFIIWCRLSRLYESNRCN